MIFFLIFLHGIYCIVRKCHDQTEEDRVFSHITGRVPHIVEQLLFAQSQQVFARKKGSLVSELTSLARGKATDDLFVDMDGIHRSVAKDCYSYVQIPECFYLIQCEEITYQIMRR